MGNEAPKDVTQLTLADLKTAADFKDDGVAAPPLSEKASATPDAKEKIEFENALGVGATTEVIDIYDGDPEGKALWNEMVEAVGGPEQVPIAAQDLREALSLFPEDREIIEGGGGLTREENTDATLQVIAGYREALSNPSKAAAILNDLWANPHSPVMRAYLHGRDPNLTNAITKLMQAAHNEKPVGLSKPKGDGFVY